MGVLDRLRLASEAQNPQTRVQREAEETRPQPPGEGASSGALGGRSGIPHQLHGVLPSLAVPLGNESAVSLEQSSPDPGLASEKPQGDPTCSAFPSPQLPATGL